MKAPSNPKIEELLRNPRTRQIFRQQIKQSGGLAGPTGKRTIAVPDTRNSGRLVHLDIVPAVVPF